jgi:hypothetical protein
MALQAAAVAGGHYPAHQLDHRPHRLSALLSLLACRRCRQRPAQALE